MDEFESLTEFEEMPEAQQRRVLYRISLANNKMLEKHAPVIDKILDYENTGKDIGKWMVRIFTGAIIAGITVWITTKIK